MLNLTFNSKKAAKKFANVNGRQAQATNADLASKGFIRQTRTLWINFQTNEIAECPGAAQ